MENKIPETKSVPGEEVIFEKKPTTVILIVKLVALVIALGSILYLFTATGFGYWWVFVAIILVGIFVAGVIYLTWHKTIFRLTNKRVENCYGIVGTREEQITLDDVQAVDVETNFWGAILNYGTVMIKAAGTKREVDFTNIHDAKKIANQIEDLTTRYKRIHGIKS